MNESLAAPIDRTAPAAAADGPFQAAPPALVSDLFAVAQQLHGTGRQREALRLLGRLEQTGAAGVPDLLRQQFQSLRTRILAALEEGRAAQARDRAALDLAAERWLAYAKPR